MAGRATCRRSTDAHRHRPRLLISAALFEKHGLQPELGRLLDDFQRHWPTDGDHIYVDFIRDGIRGNGAARTGNRRWRRLQRGICRRHQIGLSLRRAGLGGEIDPRWASLAAVHPPAVGIARSFLAIRRLGYPGRPFGDCRGLSVTVAPGLPRRRWHTPISTTPTVSPLGSAADRDRMLPGYLKPESCAGRERSRRAGRGLRFWVSRARDGAPRNALGVGPKQAQSRCTDRHVDARLLYSLSRGNTSLANKLSCRRSHHAKANRRGPSSANCPCRRSARQKSTI